MRPHELTLDGFRSYAAATTISWQDRRLVGIVGPIGSGKSSILDGISFALYGRTPRVERDVKGLINQRRDEGKVALTFSVDGSVWKVVRALRRHGQSAHALYRLQDGEGVEVAAKAREVTERITELLGLDFDAFRRSVLLAQNQFAGFLEATPGKRNDVLKGVFGFERLDVMRAAARSRRDAAAAELTALERYRERAEQDRKDLAGAREEQQAVGARVVRLEAAREPMASIDAALAAVHESLKALETERVRLEGIADRIPDGTETETVLGGVEAADAVIAAAADRAAAAGEAMQAASGAFDEVVAETGGREALDRARTLLARYEEQDAAAKRAARQSASAAEAAELGRQAAVSADAAAAEAAAALEESLRRSRAAAAEVEAAEAGLHDATHRDLAASLRSDLAEGDTCPVCEQPVSRVPPPIESGLDAARSALREAREAAARARDDEITASEALAGSRAAADAAADDVERLSGRLREAAGHEEQSAAIAAATLQEVAALVGDEGDPAEALASRTESLDAAEATRGRARRELDTANRELEVARLDAQEAHAGLEALRTRLAELAGRLGLEGLGLAGGVDVLREAARALREAWIERNAEIADAVREAGAQRQAAEARRAEVLREAGLDAEADLAAEIARVREQKAALDERIAGLEKRLDDLARLEREQADLIAGRDRYQRLFDDLAPAGFPAFVLDDRRRALAALGSERFEYLSDGWYRFTDDGEFSIVDLSAADQTRPAASLSGGETFLASLALALALAEIVVREGGRLDAFFLDEGFGSLDAEHVDLAMAGIERLVTEGPDRLIVVVSHVTGLRDRLEDLIVLAKDHKTGDTIVRSGAAAQG